MIVFEKFDKGYGEYSITLLCIITLDDELLEDLFVDEALLTGRDSISPAAALELLSAEVETYADKCASWEALV